MNRVTIIGRLGKDPEVRATPSGQSVCNFTVATTEKYKDEKKTEWHNIVAWGKLADVCGRFLSKGREVAIEGKLATRSWEKDGQKQYRTEIVASSIEFIGGQRQEGGQGYDQNVNMDEDIPFVADLDLSITRHLPRA